MWHQPELNFSPCMVEETRVAVQWKGMSPYCPYCKESFERSRYHPDQTVCSVPDCQRQRRAAYHRRKLQDDPLYRDQCRDSQQQWREQHPEYMRTYREKHKSSKAQPHAKAPPDLTRLLECVKNNVAIDLKAYPAMVLLIASEGVKNSVATAEIILVQGLPNK
jgi:hypothetical protein